MERAHSRLIYNRIKFAYNLKNDFELANFLGTSQNGLSTAISRNKVNWEIIISKCTDLSIDWLLTEKGFTFRNPTKNMEEISFLRDKIALLEDKIKDKEDLLKEKDKIISMLTEKTSQNNDEEHFRVG